LINKRLGEVLWCTEGSLGAWMSEDGDWKGVHTGRRQWRTATRRGFTPGGANGGRRRLGWKRVRARDGRGSLISAQKVGWGRWGHVGATCTRAKGRGMAGDVRRSGGQWRATGGAPAGGSAPPGTTTCRGRLE
jgi:hypothetical protein